MQIALALCVFAMPSVRDTSGSRNRALSHDARYRTDRLMLITALVRGSPPSGRDHHIG